MTKLDDLYRLRALIASSTGFPQQGLGKLATRVVRAGVTRGTIGATKRPLGGASTPLVQGASPTLMRSID